MKKNAENIRALVIGLGRSGRAGAEALVKLGAEVDVYDGNDDVEKRQWAAGIGASASFGESPAHVDGYDMMVLSPGVPTDKPYVIQAEEAGAEIIGELELAYRYGNGRYIAITGTNGKTTTTTLVGEIFKNAGKKTEVVGNIGVAVMTRAMDVSDDTYLVTECSSFQLDTTVHFRPQVSALLNITPDHLDRHKTMENYTLAKAKIFANQSADQYFVYNADDELVAETVKNCKAMPVPFSRRKQLDFGAFVKDGNIVIRDKNVNFVVCRADQLKIPGLHNLENALAAAAIAYFAGIGVDVIASSLKSFGGVEHRIEDCGTVNGVKYINDSKGTNPDAAIKAVISFENVILIAGGYDKGASYDEFIASFEGRVKELVLMGATAPKIREAAEKAGFKNIHMVKDMKDAVETSSKIAVKGDTVLLSPACASWDMYKKFEDRGDDFRNCVKELR
ncbi:MAG: UDP-N-acetylmuramoyl-L-alanine--D-glutamate ligase [Firmicutes bacterium]|nr:UDP-N-acetylmuramoyl-L-alanine--D-glutamate ligase [Bacillota bacterium]